MNSPSLLIVTDLHSLFAYLLEVEGMPIILERVDFHCDGQTHVPLTSCHPEWKEQEQSRVIAQKIEEILEKYQPESWGLACPECNKVVDQLRHCHERKLTIRLTVDVSDVHVGNVAHLFIPHSKFTHSPLINR